MAIPSSEELTKTFMQKINQILLPHFSLLYFGSLGGVLITNFYLDNLWLMRKEFLMSAFSFKLFN